MIVPQCSFSHLSCYTSWLTCSDLGSALHSKFRRSVIIPTMSYICYAFNFSMKFALIWAFDRTLIEQFFSCTDKKPPRTFARPTVVFSCSILIKNQHGEKSWLVPCPWEITLNTAIQCPFSENHWNLSLYSDYQWCFFSKSALYVCCTCLVYMLYNWASSRENLSSGFATR